MGQEVDVQNKHIDRIAGKVWHMTPHALSDTALTLHTDGPSRRPDCYEQSKAGPYPLIGWSWQVKLKDVIRGIRPCARRDACINRTPYVFT